MVLARELVEVAPGVLVATSVVYRTSSTVLLGDDGTCLLVDPGITAKEIAGLAAAVGDRGLRPIAVWSTHHHWDHLLDGPDLSGLPRWGVPVRPGRQPGARNLQAARDEDDELAAAVAADAEDAVADIAAVPTGFPVRFDESLASGQRLDWPGPPVVVFAHAAHAPAHTVLHLPEVGVAIAGDMLSDIEIPLLDDVALDPVGDYRAALDALESLEFAVVVPGHGHVGTDVPDRLARDRAYLDSLAQADPARDPRAVAGWLQAQDDRQRAFVRATEPPRSAGVAL